MFGKLVMYGTVEFYFIVKTPTTQWRLNNWLMINWTRNMRFSCQKLNIHVYVFLDEFKKHNDELADIDMKIFTVIPRKRNSYTYNDVIIEVKGESYNFLLSLGTLNLHLWPTINLFFTSIQINWFVITNRVSFNA